MAYEIMNSQQVFKGKVFAVRQDQVQLPDGKTVRLDIVDHNDSVSIVPLDSDGKIWFIQQYRHPTGKVLLELPAGVMDAGEQPETSARRELREEIGMAAGQWRQLGEFYLAPGYCTENMFVFLASQLQADALPPDEDEDITVEKISIVEAYALAERGEINDSKSLAALMLARPFLLA